MGSISTRGPGATPERSTALHRRREVGAVCGARVVVAFLVTPVVAGAVWFVRELGLQLLLDGRLSAKATAQFFAGGMTFGVVYAALITVGIAVPCYLLLLATVGVSGRITRIAGAAIGALSGFSFAYVGALEVLEPVTGGVIGWIVAALWWRIASRGAGSAASPPSSAAERRASRRTRLRISPPALEIIAAAIVLLSTGATVEATGQRRRIPDRIATAGGSADRWISESELSRVDRSSWSMETFPRMRWGGGFFAAVREVAKGRLACVNRAHWEPSHPQGYDFSFAGAVRRSTAIFVGTVAERKRGVFDGTPGELLLVDLDEIIGEKGRRTSSDAVVIFYETPYLEIAGVPACVGKAAGMPPAPAVGDRVLLLPPSAPSRNGGLVTQLPVARHGVFFESAGRLWANEAVASASPDLFGDASATQSFDTLKSLAVSLWRRDGRE